MIIIQTHFLKTKENAQNIILPCAPPEYQSFLPGNASQEAHVYVVAHNKVSKLEKPSLRFVFQVEISPYHNHGEGHRLPGYKPLASSAPHPTATPEQITLANTMGFFSRHFGGQDSAPGGVGVREHGARKGPFGMSFGRFRGLKWRRGKFRKRGKATMNVSVSTGPF